MVWVYIIWEQASLFVLDFCIFEASNVARSAGQMMDWEQKPGQKVCSTVHGMGCRDLLLEELLYTMLDWRIINQFSYVI